MHLCPVGIYYQISDYFLGKPDIILIDRRCCMAINPVNNQGHALAAVAKRALMSVAASKKEQISGKEQGQAFEVKISDAAMRQAETAPKPEVVAETKRSG
jgi:hypothetical protein